MRIQLARGNIHSDKWTRDNIFEIPGETAEGAAYAAVRAKHGFLADTPHSWDAGEREIEWGGKTSIFNSVRIYRDEAMQDYWFGVEYRVLEASVGKGEG
jgi:hypothetical protein